MGQKLFEGLLYFQDKNGILDELREKFRREIVDIHEFHLW
jgi:hypothetical protein